jgi:hypothetical protein
MNDELKGYVMKRLWLNLSYYHGICLEGLRETTESLSGYPVSAPKFEPGTSEILSKIPNHLATAFPLTHY